MARHATQTLYVEHLICRNDTPLEDSLWRDAQVSRQCTGRTGGPYGRFKRFFSVHPLTVSRTYLQLQAYLLWICYKDSLQMLHMAKSEKALKVGAALRLARKRRGKVMREIASHLGVDVVAVGNWENGKNLPATGNLLKVADYLKIDAALLGNGDVRFLDVNEDLADVEVVSDFAPFQGGPKDIKLLGASVGGDDGDFTFNGQVIGYVRRPAGIANMNDVFAVHVIGDSMEPRFEPGDMIYCSPRTPVAGDDVVIELFPAEGDTAGKAYIKRLVKQSKGLITCKQYNPPKEIEFNLYEVKRVYRVIPLRELVGF